jgi:hypothetical protein
VSRHPPETESILIELATSGCVSMNWRSSQ